MNITEDIARLLVSVKRSGEGNLLINIGRVDSEIQTNFLSKYLKEINPANILETGTNSGCFSILVKETLGKRNIHTFGIDEWSEECINKIHEHYGEKFINFYVGNSLQTLSNFSLEEKIDFAWVDGGHEFNVATSDLKNCQRLNIKNIFVDDYNYITSVRNAVDNFVSISEYIIADLSIDERGVVYLKARP